MVAASFLSGPPLDKRPLVCLFALWIQFRVLGPLFLVPSESPLNKVFVGMDFLLWFHRKKQASSLHELGLSETN